MIIIYSILSFQGEKDRQIQQQYDNLDTSDISGGFSQWGQGRGKEGSLRGVRRDSLRGVRRGSLRGVRRGSGLGGILSVGGSLSGVRRGSLSGGFSQWGEGRRKEGGVLSEG